MTRSARGRSGWKAEEEALLFEEIQKSSLTAAPLRTVFEAVANKTGRKPNSIRNYYYARIKEKDLSTAALHAGAFIPFDDSEIRSLLRTVLSAQANGISVRSCTMSMGGGDNKAMLRYQNKYRALLKNRPRLVREVAEELKAEGIDFDPYCERRRGSRDILERLKSIEGFDPDKLIESLEGMAGAVSDARLGEQRARAERDALMERLRHKEEELQKAQGQLHTLLMLYRRLVSANRDFIGKASRESGSASEYARQMAQSVADCERALVEYNA